MDYLVFSYLFIVDLPLNVFNWVRASACHCRYVSFVSHSFFSPSVPLSLATCSCQAGDQVERTIHGWPAQELLLQWATGGFGRGGRWRGRVIWPELHFSDHRGEHTLKEQVSVSKLALFVRELTWLLYCHLIYCHLVSKFRAKDYIKLFWHEPDCTKIILHDF